MKWHRTGLQASRGWDETKPPQGCREESWCLPGVRGGDAQLAVQSKPSMGSGSASISGLAVSQPSRPENMGFSGVDSIRSQSPGLPMLLPADDSGGVDG